MEKKIHFEYIEQYATYFSSELCKSVFATQSKLNGGQIIKMCSLKQINFFVLKSLFNRWQEETGRFQSPYFDFTHPDVKKTYAEFANMLSKNILVDEKHIMPLIELAVKETLWLLLSPTEYFIQQTIGEGKKRITLKGLQNLNRYIKINKFLLDDLLANFEKERIMEVDTEEFEQILLQFSADNESSFETIQAYIRQFEEWAPLDIAQLYLDEPKKIVHEIEWEVEGDDNQLESLDDEWEMQDTEPVDSKPEVQEPVTLFEKIKSQEPEKQTIAQQHEEQIKNSLWQSITLNQRYMFTNELFGGNSNLFQKAIETIDKLNNFDDSVAYLVKEYAKDLEWDMNSPEVKDLLKVLFRRFR